MAVYEGARPRSAISRLGTAGIGLDLPRTRVDQPALPRRRTRAAVRARRRSSRVGLLLGGIVVAFALAFFSLVQSMQVSATGYRIDRLESQRQELESDVRQVTSDLERLGGEPAIRKQALTLGLGQLDRPLVVSPR